MESHQLAIVTKEKTRVKELKNAAEDKGIYDKTRLITSSPEDGEYLIPVNFNAYQLLTYHPVTCNSNQYEVDAPPPFQQCLLTCGSTVCERNRVRHKSDTVSQMESAIREWSMRNGLNEAEIEELIGCVPVAWVRHGDLIVVSLRTGGFGCPVWKKVLSSSGKGVWQELAGVLNCKRIVIQEKVANDSYRSPVNHLVLGEEGWVTHTDNGVCYVFDATKTMFSQGNITEKIRMAGFNCKGEVVVDLFAGIGYFTLPVLVHGGAERVYACEWSPAAVEGLKRGLLKNRVSERCVVLEGDNNQVAPRGVADRVILGLIPSSEGSWETGCACIRPDKGGWLHIHGNITTALRGTERREEVRIDKDQENLLMDHGTTEARVQLSNRCENDLEDPKKLVTSSDLLKQSSQEWSDYVTTKVTEIFNRLYEHSHPNLCTELGNGPRWSIRVGQIEYVKSYAPRVHHVVVDVECRPTKII